MVANKSISSSLLHLFIALSKVVAWIVLFLYVLVPLLLYYYPQAVSPFVFLHNMFCPLDVYYTDFEYYGFNSSLSHDFRLVRETETGEHVSLGAWYLAPASLSHILLSSRDRIGETEVHDADTERYDLLHKALQTDTRVLFYVHGASGTRANAHRVELYRKALESDLQVFTFDYRGYADSSGMTRSERDAVQDARAAYEWLQAARYRKGEQAANVTASHLRDVVMWAHSLGTGITLRLLADLVDSIEDDSQLQSSLPETVVLESPFHDLIEASYHYPISLPYRHTPLFEAVFIRAVNEIGIRFASASNAARICRRIPSLRMLILHAADDIILPIELGRHLYDAMLRAGCKNVRFVEFAANLGYGHRHIHRAPEVQRILRYEV